MPDVTLTKKEMPYLFAGKKLKNWMKEQGLDFAERQHNWTKNIDALMGASREAGRHEVEKTGYRLVVVATIFVPVSKWVTVEYTVPSNSNINLADLAANLPTTMIKFDVRMWDEVEQKVTF